MTQHESRRITYGEFFKVANDLKPEVPFSLALWYPNTAITQNRLWFLINVFLFQWIPAYFIDFLLLIFRQKRLYVYETPAHRNEMTTFFSIFLSMVHVQKKIAVGMDVLAFFTMSDWNFKSDNFANLVKIQSKAEYDMFWVDTLNAYETTKYLKITMFGGREYCAKDPLTTLPKAKIIFKM